MTDNDSRQTLATGFDERHMLKSPHGDQTRYIKVRDCAGHDPAKERSHGDIGTSQTELGCSDQGNAAFLRVKVPLRKSRISDLGAMMLTKTLSVMGMKCSGCAAKISKAIADVAGVEKIEVSLERGTVTLDYDEKVTGLEQLRAEINSLGYGIDDLKVYSGNGCSCGLSGVSQ